ncbi:MAG TPA: hypothetical protein VGI67_09370 [Thermoleophilaceae bacterium]|jgi:hypothetical protein
MADRVLFISWGASVPGREERSLEVFNEVVGLYGRYQQEGRIESFDVVLLNGRHDIEGFMALHGTHEQLDAVEEDDDFRRALTDAALIVENLRVAEGVTNEGVARDMALYQEAISKVPQNA